MTTQNPAPSAVYPSGDERVQPVRAAAGEVKERPTFQPFMLRGLTYSQVLQQMRVTGCAGRRHHWCSPVILYDGAELIFDNEDQRDPWEPTAEDRRATDWEMVERPACPICEDAGRATWLDDCQECNGGQKNG